MAVYGIFMKIWILLEVEIVLTACSERTRKRQTLETFHNLGLIAVITRQRRERVERERECEGGQR